MQNDVMNVRKALRVFVLLTLTTLFAATAATPQDCKLSTTDGYVLSPKCGGYTGTINGLDCWGLPRNC